ncbi:N-acetylmuramoyl-L-alanine amidase [Insulibacter thermoxylanivorax]|nr:N-acetylmuramoyl-L-alanine amidase [Insulibacter thermoxylanivorax]
MKRTIIVVLTAVMLLVSPLTAGAATVLLDPGHGGSDPGAIGVTGLYEKEVNLDIALKVRDELERRGYDVIMTRTTDTYLSLQERIMIAEQVKPDILVSIHANSFHRPDVKGTLVLYYDNRYPQQRYPASEAMIRLSPESRKLAEALLEAAVEAAGTVNRGLLASSVYMVRMGSMPSALIETAFLSNPEDEQLLKTQEFREKMAVGIANGIERYLPPRFRDIAGHWASKSILHLFKQGIVEGDGRYYYPDRSLTRAEFVAMLDRSGLLDEPESDMPATPIDLVWNVETLTEAVYGEASGTEPEIPVFHDLDESHWAYANLVKAIEAGILEGFVDGTIRPDGEITRAEVIVIIDRLLHGEEEQQDVQAATPAEAFMRYFQSHIPFVDVPVAEWFTNAVYRLYDLKIINGVSETSFAPHKLMSRAEAAVLIDRYLSSGLEESYKM